MDEYGLQDLQEILLIAYNMLKYLNNSINKMENGKIVCYGAVGQQSSKACLND